MLVLMKELMMMSQLIWKPSLSTLNQQERAKILPKTSRTLSRALLKTTDTAQRKMSNGHKPTTNSAVEATLTSDGSLSSSGTSLSERNGLFNSALISD